MIQFNLLPSVKLEYVRAKRHKRLTILAAGLVGSVSLAVMLVLFFSVQVIQKKYSSDLSKDIKKESQTLKNQESLNKVLTVQNQLNTLPGLHDKKPVTSLLYNYLRQFTPTKVTIASVDVNFEENTMQITGSAESIVLINKFIDTLKFTNYTSEGNEGTRAFSEVVLISFGRDDKSAQYELTMKYDPAIFSSRGKPALVIPANKITTRSEIEKPGNLFEPLPIPEGNNR